MIFASLPAGPRRLSALPLTRHALLVGTILGAGVIMVAPVARAADQMINLTTPQTNATTEYIADGSDSITVNQAAGATISNGSTDGIYASTLNGSINLGGTTGLQASISGVSGVTGIVTDGAGSITIKSVAGGTINGTLGRGVLTRANSGTTTIDLGANATGNGEGIDAASTSGNITIKTASGTTITGGSGGIVTNSTAGGATSITFNGDVKSAAGSAIWAQSTSGTIEITGSGNATQTVGATSGGGGIAASTQTGAIIVGGTGNTSGSGGALVNLQITDQSAQTNIVVMRSGSYTATNGAAIYAKNEGSGAVNLVNLGSITQTGAFAFNVGGYPNAAVIVKANGEINIGGVAGLSNAVTSDNSGIYAETTGNKDINIRTATGGTITAKNGVAIQTSAETGTTNINIGDTVSGATTGIYATSTTGAINITSTSTVTGNSDYAIVADNHLATVAIGDSGVKSTATNATVRINSATGIYISNSGNGGNNGAIVVLTKGEISSSANGIEVSNVGDAITIGESETKITNAVSGWRGILASNTGANGTISITTGAGGAVTGTRNQGIATSAQGGATNISLGDTVTGATKGVLSNATTGAINITSTSTVTGTGDYAIAAANNLAIVTIGSDSGGESTATNATVKINSSTGIVAKNGGNGGNNGAVTVQTLGAVTSSGIGIDASNVGDAINIGTSAAKITKAVSGTTGINAANTDTGTISILTGAGGTVRGTSGAGITSQAENGAMTIDVGANVTGATTGILTVSSGSASTATTSITIRTGVTVASSVSDNRAIDARTNKGNVTINNAGTVNGNIRGLININGGTGTFTFNNAGTFSLGYYQTNVGFTINNQSGGVLTGIGFFGEVNAASGSIIRPGDRTLTTPAMGTLNATSLTLAAGAIVDVRADYSGVADKVAVTGAAALNGATLNITATPRDETTWSEGKTFTILTASSGVTGTFATTTLDYAFLKATLTYNANSVDMKLDRNWRSFGTYATSFNQKIAADIFDKFQTQTTNPVISRLTTLTVSQAPIALTQLAGTGVVATRTQSFAAGSVFSGAINSEMGRFTSSAGGSSSVLSYAEDTKIKSKAFDKIAPKPEPIPDGRIWAQMLGGIGNMKSDANNPSQRGSNYGLAAGADTAINANLRAGFALSLGQSTTKVSSLATSTESTWGQGALYAVATDGDTYLKGALTYGYLDSKTDRSVTAFGTVDKAKGKFGANLYSVRLEAGQKFAFDPVNLTPFLAFEPSWLMQNAYNETGPASITLGFGKTTSRALPTTLGGRIDAAYDLGDYRMTPSASLGWVHDFATSGSISPFFTALPGSNFTAQGSRNDRNLARAELNIEASPKDTWATIYLNARADIGARTNAVRGVAGMSLRF